jgi:hypothetical protein
MSRLIPTVLSAVLLAASINHAEASPAERLGEAVRLNAFMNFCARPSRGFSVNWM